MNSEVTTAIQGKALYHYKRRYKQELYPTPHSLFECKSPLVLSINSDEVTVVWTDQQRIGICVDDRIIGADIRYCELESALSRFLRKSQSAGAFLAKPLLDLHLDADLVGDLLEVLGLKNVAQKPLQELNEQDAFKILLAHWCLDGVTAICIPEPEKIKRLDKTLSGLRHFFEDHLEDIGLPAIIVLDRFGDVGLGLIADCLYEKDNKNRWVQFEID